MIVRFGSVKVLLQASSCPLGWTRGRLVSVGRRSNLLARGVATITSRLAIAPRSARTWCRKLLVLGAGRIDSAMASERRFDIWPME